MLQYIKVNVNERGNSQRFKFNFPMNTILFLCISIPIAYGENIEYTGDAADFQQIPMDYGMVSGSTQSIFSTIDTSHNSVIINDVLSTNAPDGVFGGLSNVNNNEASNNVLELLKGRVNGYIFGGYHYVVDNINENLIATANNNYLKIYGGRLTHHLNGGLAVALATRGTAIAAADSNIVELKAGIFERYLILVGGQARSNSEEQSDSFSRYNRVIIDTDVNEAVITGGDAEAISLTKNSTATAEYNTIEVNSVGKISQVTGGFSRSSGADISVANSNFNTVIINKGVIASDVIGGLAISIPYTDSIVIAHATNNRVEINGGQIEGNIYGGNIFINNPVERAHYLEVKATDNSITISGNPTFAMTTNLYGGIAKVLGSSVTQIQDVFTNNSLNIHTKNILVNEVMNFEYYNYFFPATVFNGDTLLKVNSADIDQSKFEVKAIAAGSPLIAGDYVQLIAASTSLTGTPILVDSKVAQGISLFYDVALEQNGNVIVAKIVGNKGVPYLPATVNPDTKILLDGNLVNLAMVTQGADFISEKLYVRDHFLPGHISSFSLIEGNYMLYETGSDIELESINVSAGLGYKTTDDRLFVGAFLESGWSDYDIDGYATSGGSINGYGNAHFYGVGLISFYNVNERFHLEGSLRLGKVNTDFASSDLVNFAGLRANYELNSTYYGFHFGGGYQRPLAEKTTLHLDLKYLWTRIKSADRLILNDPIHFDALDSQRVRFMTSVEHKQGPNLKLRGGIGYEYEFDGKARGTTHYVYNLPRRSLKGASALAEIGLNYAPKENKNLNIDISVRGYSGKKNGAGGRLQVTYSF